MSEFIIEPKSVGLAVRVTKSQCSDLWSAFLFGVGLGGVVEALLLLVERLDVEVALETIDPPVRESAR